MSIGAGEGKGTRSSINVTPLIDVLLVLLIIFMVIQPSTMRGLDALVPQPPKGEAPENPQTVMVQIASDGSGGAAYRINEDAVPVSELTARLTNIFAARENRVLFVRGGKDLDFGSVIPVLDSGHAAGVDNIGIITPAVEKGS